MAEILTPDCWVFIRVRVGDKVTHRIAASWAGSFAWGGSWLVSSAIGHVADAKDRLTVTTQSGIKYHLLRGRQRQSMMIGTALAELRNALGESNVEITAETTPENETWNP